MIAYLIGKIKDINNNSLTLLIGGVGYLIFVPKNTLENIELNQEYEFFIYTKVREDEISLFGFQTKEESNFFYDLISVNGIGPKSALEILNSPIDQVKTAILQENPKYLSQVPGIGKKTAERIIVELKNKVQPKQIEKISNTDEILINEAISALTNLGYQRYEINRVLKTLPTKVTAAEEIITFFLKNV